MQSKEPADLNRKLSNSSDEIFMDTSDEYDDGNPKANKFFIEGRNDGNVTEPRPRPSGYKPPTSDEQADEVIKDAERSKAKLYEVPGKVISQGYPNIDSIALMDNEYQMIGSHLDKQIKRKIQCFEYVDFSKLVHRNKSFSDDQRLELISKNGMTYLSPMSERKAVNINSYLRSEQAFIVYSNVLTECFPQKATELLQYNHTIHTASMSYIWDNVYHYDKEFRHHISRHPTWSWAVILQQAWTIILKDRVR